MNQDEKADQYDKAIIPTEKADALPPNNSEIFALKRYIKLMKMAVEPTVRAHLVAQTEKC